MTNPSIQVQALGRTHAGRVRENNEDAFAIVNLSNPPQVVSTMTLVALAVEARGVLLAVSDGMGGTRAGEIASATTLRTLVDGMVSVEAGSAEAALRQCVEGANARVWNAAHTTAVYAGMGATLAAVLIYGSNAYVVGVGDSRVYVLRGTRLVRVTHDQSLVQELVDSGVLTEREAETSEARSVIMKGMGLKPTVVVPMTRFPLRQGDRFLLCSDGLSEKVGDEELRRAVSTVEAMETTCAILLDLALERGGEDNITMILSEISGAGVPPLTDAERVSPATLMGFRAD